MEEAATAQVKLIGSEGVMEDTDGGHEVVEKQMLHMTLMRC